MMTSKTKTTYQCTSCKAYHVKQAGQCHFCKAWNCIKEVTVEKKVKYIAHISVKRKAQLDEERLKPDGDAVLKEKWFQQVRTLLTGICQCGCGQPSQKNSDEHFRSSCCHIFPKKKFPSVKNNLINFVERAVWGGCHSQLDDRSMDKWVNMADWENIKKRFYKLSPLLTEKEKATKFYTQFENLVKNN